MIRRYKLAKRMKAVKMPWLEKFSNFLFGTAENKKDEETLDHELNAIIDVLINSRNNFEDNVDALSEIHATFDAWYQTMLTRIRKAGPTIWKRVGLDAFVSDFVAPYIYDIIPPIEEGPEIDSAINQIVDNFEDAISYLAHEVDKEYFKSADTPTFEDMEAFLSDVDIVLDKQTTTNIVDYPDVEWESFYIDGSTPEQAVSEVFGFEGSKSALKAFGNLEGNLYSFFTNYQDSQYELPFPEDAIDITIDTGANDSAEVTIEGESIFPYNIQSLRTSLVDVFADWGYVVEELDMDASGSGYEFKEYNIYVILTSI